MTENTLSAGEVQRFYNRIGKRYDWFGTFESRAKARGIDLLSLTPGLRLLHVGLGTGKEHAQIAQRLAPSGIAYGLDLSTVVVRLTGARSETPLCQADALCLPYAKDSFDRLYAAYVLDLLSGEDTPLVLGEFSRVLKPGGRLVLIALTEGVTAPSRSLVGAWKLAFSISPTACGGCRPIQLASLVESAGLRLACREVVIQLALPSEVIAAHKPA